MLRNKRYFAAEKSAREVGRILANWETRPIKEFKPFSVRYAERKLETFSIRCLKIVDGIVERRIIEYYKPVVQGQNGEWYSAADMDAKMLNGNI